MGINMKIPPKNGAQQPTPNHKAPLIARKAQPLGTRLLVGA
jgi:hypothetical protein